MAEMDSVVHFEMPYENKERVVSFYQQAFGWQMQVLGPEMGGYVTAATTEIDENRMIKMPGAINGGFFPKKPDWPAQYPSVVIAVDDINLAMQKVIDAGGKILGEPTEIPGIGHYVSFTDTEGNRVSILQPFMNYRPPNKEVHTTTKFVPYLSFAGKTEEAFNFYKSVFGGEFKAIVRFKDMPMAGANISKADENKIMHIALPLGKEDMIMASDVLEGFGHKLIQGNNTAISIFPDSKEEADRLFKGLSAGGMVEMPLINQMWGDYYGGLTDKFGIRWMVDYIYPKAK
jgi:uncharacterized glyoxalase superfamily protein PhnB